jgi:hypothetical protein
MKNEKPVGFILTLLFLGWLLGSPGDAEPAVESAVTSTERGGDTPSLPQDVAVPGTDAPPTPGSDVPPTTPVVASEPLTSCQCNGDPSRCSCTNCRCSVRCAIASYRKGGGQRAYVRGKSDWLHLVNDHGWDSDQLRGLTVDDLQYLHGASHAGKLESSQFVAASTNAAPFNPGAAVRHPTAPGADKPSITIHLADFKCPPCDVLKGYDWQDFDVTWVTGGADAYPSIAWHDKDGMRRVLRGAYSPWRVKWSWERTQ